MGGPCCRASHTLMIPLAVMHSIAEELTPPPPSLTPNSPPPSPPAAARWRPQPKAHTERVALSLTPKNPWLYYG